MVFLSALLVTAGGAAADGPLARLRGLHFCALVAPFAFANKESSIVPSSATTVASDWTRASQPSVCFGPM
jgi:hypothetical protein